MKILVMSCDKNNDLWEPFYHCIEKYWPNHPEIIYSTETLNNPYYKTICLNYTIEKWTKRARETVEKIDDKYILLMCDDIFITNYVDESNIESLINYIDNDTASINLHICSKSDNKKVNNLINIRNKHNCLTSVMCGIWNKSNLIKIFSIDRTPWELEESSNDYNNYKFFIVNKSNIINFGYNKKGDLFGVFMGKWIRKTVNFLLNDGCNIDTSIRGFYD